MRLFSGFLVAIALLSAGCGFVPSSKDLPIIEGLPGMKLLTDSLNRTGVKVVKWAVHEGEVVYSTPKDLDWKTEFQAFSDSTVNLLRYKDAYHVSDTMIGSERTVRFEARSKSQEVKLLEVRIRHGRVVSLIMEKSRSNLFSNSRQRFEFGETHYQVEMEQHIRWLFSSKQFAYGTLVNKGDLWRGVFDIGERQMPIQFILSQNGQGGEPSLFVKNGREKIGFNHVSTEGDTVVFGSDYFDSRFKLAFTSDSTLSGVWVNAKRAQEKRLHFSAKKDVPYRFRAQGIPTVDLTGLHTAVFYDHDGNVDDTTLLQLKQSKHLVTGSFLTETGDYRYLEGVVRNDSLLLSSMDGTHAFYFEAAIADGKLNGSFHSGKHWVQPWVAEQHEVTQLRDPESITSLRPGASFDFAFQDEQGDSVALSDAAFAGKPMVISIMGTWCSNCLDEATFLKELHETYADRGLEVVALDFELINDSTQAIRNIERHKQSLDIDFPVLLASLNSTKQKASEKLPSLNGVFSYPTMIVLDKNHKVVRIHTGFSGPATGVEYYDRFRMEYIGLIDSLVRE